MVERDFVPPVRRTADGWVMSFDDDERELLVRLMGELHDLLSTDDTSPLLDRLFPTAYPDDAEKEAEYQRLMRDELVMSRLAAIETVRTTVGPGGPAAIDEDQTLAFMQAINAVRLVLGSMLEIDDEEEVDEDDELDDSPERHLYTFLSWVLEWTVRALSPNA